MPTFSAVFAARPSLRRSRTATGHRGQAIVEYILALAIIISIVTIVSTGFRKSLFRLWEFYGRQISAPCPGCPADPAVRLR